jgi:hypothetical protein
VFNNEEFHNFKYFEIILRLPNQGVRQILNAMGVRGDTIPKL